MTMPERLQRRPQWKGFPVPFTTIVAPDGTPNFKVTDTGAWNICTVEKLCALCGERLGYWAWYLGSKDHIEGEQFFDLGMHEECARYAAETCPYIAFGRAYGEHVKPVEGAVITEIVPREALSNAGVPIYLARGRSSAISVFEAQAQVGGPMFRLVRSGTLQDVQLVGHFANKN